MLQNEVFPNYRKYVDEMNRAYAFIKSQFSENGVEELCKLRGYVSGSQIALLHEMEIGAAEISGDLFEDYDPALNFVTKNGNFLLSGRYIIPVYGVNGDLISLIGYYPDDRKYITLPTPFFAKECMFFNFNQAYELSWSDFKGYVILVEGIFDCLSLRSTGLPCIATMGSSVSKIKGELLKLFDKVLAIPDDDETGRKALNQYSRYGWKVPYNTTFMRFHGGTFQCGEQTLHCKDMDNFVSWYDEKDVFDILMSYADCKEDIVDFSLE